MKTILTLTLLLFAAPALAHEGHGGNPGHHHGGYNRYRGGFYGGYGGYGYPYYAPQPYYAPYYAPPPYYYGAPPVYAPYRPGVGFGFNFRF